MYVYAIGNLSERENRICRADLETDSDDFSRRFQIGLIFLRLLYNLL